MRYTNIITSHQNPYLSGVARFNIKLSKELNTVLYQLKDSVKITSGRTLCSFKLIDHNSSEKKLIFAFLKHLKKNNLQYDILFHTYNGLDIEKKLITNAEKIYSANDEIASKLTDCKKKTVIIWCPALINNNREIKVNEFNIFSFGMAHKINLSYYQKLEKILRKSELEYSLWISTAFHEKANFGDFDRISNELKTIFDKNIYFLGFLSDSSVNHFMKKAQLFAAFFDGGLRANNTSVFAAMSQSCPVITNCDQFSPKFISHGKNIVDIDKIESKLDVRILKNIGIQAKKDMNKNINWPDLLKLLG